MGAIRRPMFQQISRRINAFHVFGVLTTRSPWKYIHIDLL